MTASSVAGSDRGSEPFEDRMRTELLSGLLTASGRHDEQAFARLYQLTSPWIYAVTRQWTGSTAPAEDATRLVYVTTWRRASTYAPLEQSALVWLTLVAYELLAGIPRHAASTEP